MYAKSTFRRAPSKNNAKSIENLSGPSKFFPGYLSPAVISRVFNDTTAHFY
jgi:hypothetical protein